MLTVRYNQRQPVSGRRLALRKTWRPSSRSLVNVYDTIEDVEAVVIAPPLHQRLRRPLVLGASMLAAAYAVYLGFVHGSDLRVGTPVAVSGKVQTQNVKPLAVLPQKSVAAAAQKPANAAASKPAITIAQTPANAATQKPVATVVQTPANAPASKPANAITQTPAIAIAQTPANIIVQKPAAAAVQKTAPIVARQPQQPAPVITARSAPVTAPPGPPPAARHVASAASIASIASIAPATSVASINPEAARNPGSGVVNQPDKPRMDVARHIRAARFELQINNLAATKARLAAAIAAQPDNREALNMRSTVRTREQQRDALLSLARGCGNIARWSCVAHNAGIALSIDSSSKDARHLVALATRETQLHMPPPDEPAADPAPEQHDVSIHH